MPLLEAGIRTCCPLPVRRRNRAWLVVAVAVAVLSAPPLTVAADAAPRLSARVLATYRANIVKVLNAERRVHGVPAVKLNTRLIVSAHQHNLRMAAVGKLSHRLPGEKFFADRMTRAGYTWSWAGENIGVSSVLSNRGVLSLQTAMYREKAPNNGHRRNILNRRFTAVGIDVFVDSAHGKIWLTQDFGRPG